MVKSIVSDPLFNTFLCIFIGLIQAVILFIIAKKEKIPLIAYYSRLLISDYQFDGLSIKYKGEEIKDLKITKVAFWNKGKDTIKKEDVDSNNPFIIIFSQNTKILNIELIGKSDSSTDPIISMKNDYSFVVDFEFLNYKDGFVFSILHSGGQSTLDISAKIKSYHGNITSKRNLVMLEQNKKNQYWFTAILYMLTIICFSIMLIGIEIPRLYFLSILTFISILYLIFNRLTINKIYIIPKSLKKYMT